MSTDITCTDILGNTYTVPASKLTWRPAAYGIIVKDGNILLTRQFGKLHLPGGGISIGETPEEAVIREIREETGLIAASPRLVGSLTDFFTYKDSKLLSQTYVQSLLLYYRAELIGGTLSTDGFMDDERIVGEIAEWIPLDRLDEIEAGSTIDWRSVVKEALR